MHSIGLFLDLNEMVSVKDITPYLYLAYSKQLILAIIILSYSGLELLHYSIYLLN